MYMNTFTQHTPKGESTMERPMPERLLTTRVREP
jgi:hypothetical protein